MEKKTDSYEIANLIWSNIMKMQYLRKYDLNDLTKFFGVATPTIYAWKKKPETMSLKYLDKFCKNTGIDISDLLK